MKRLEFLKPILPLTTSTPPKMINTKDIEVWGRIVKAVKADGDEDAISAAGTKYMEVIKESTKYLPFDGRERTEFDTLVNFAVSVGDAADVIGVIKACEASFLSNIQTESALRGLEKLDARLATSLRRKLIASKKS